MTKEEYHRLAPTFNRTEHLINQEIDQIRMNVNRAGKTYRKIIREIRKKYERD